MEMELRTVIFDTVDFHYDGIIETCPADKLTVSYDGKTGKIGYSRPAELCRGYFLFAKNFDGGAFHIEEQARFNTCGCMLDASRNGVMKVEAVKKYMRYMAALGMNLLMLYTEDTYEVPEYPYFGYMRGRYTADEIRQLDAYAQFLGIELVPCIQTLAHLTQYLKHPEADSFKDTADILLAWEEKTYRFIECELQAVKSMFSSSRVHIGMDEAHDLGRGNFLDRNGYHVSYDILTQHLRRVAALCENYGLRPMMWNDMFFRTATPDKNYYNYKQARFDPEMLRSIPQVDMVYWDYYHEDEEVFSGMIEKTKELGRKTIFAGGISIWYGFLPFGEMTERSTIAGLSACVKHGVKEVFATMWGDDGTEANAFFSVPYLPLYSEFCYKGDGFNLEDMQKTSEFLTRIPYEAVQAAGQYHFHVEDEKNIFGKAFFYSDILYELGPEPRRTAEAQKRYSQALAVIQKYLDPEDPQYAWYQYIALVYEITLIKLELREKLRRAYKASDREYLTRTVRQTLPKLKLLYAKLKQLHKTQWDAVYKPFGFEVISFRYGGAISRIDDCIATLTDYLDGRLDTIAELEETLLPTEYFGFRTKEVITPSSIF